MKASGTSVQSSRATPRRSREGKKTPLRVCSGAKKKASANAYLMPNNRFTWGSSWVTGMLGVRLVLPAGMIVCSRPALSKR